MTIYNANNIGSASYTYPSVLLKGDALVFQSSSNGQNGSFATWNVPVTGDYEIEAKGARGASGNGGSAFGYGARVIGTFTFQAGESITVFVGQVGTWGGASVKDGAAGGGGGGSFVNKGGSLILAAAGGGGGNDSLYQGSKTAGANGLFTHYGTINYTFGNNPVGSYYSRGGQWGAGGYGGGGASDDARSYGGGSYRDVNGSRSYNLGKDQRGNDAYNGGHGEVKFTLLNEPNYVPTTPASYITQPENGEIFLTNETVSLEWEAATDIDEDAIHYKVELFNGTSWSTLTSDHSATSYDAILPVNLKTSQAKFRITAIDSKNGISGVLESNTFQVSPSLLLIQDGDTLKTYKNGSWQTI